MDNEQGARPLGRREDASRPGSRPSFFENYTIEATPSEVLQSKTGLADLPEQTKVYIPLLPRNSFDDTVQAAKALRREDLVPVPHVTARTLKDAAQLADRLKRLSDECGVDEILLLAGGDARATGAFQNTLEILGTGVLERSGLARIGFAGHPEGHSDVSGSDLEKALQAKNEFARASGIACYLVTQFFFDAAPVLAWERGLRALGIQLPVHPGIHGLAGVPSLIRHAVACGVGASLKALRSSSPGLLQLAGRRDPSGLVSAIVEARASDPDSLFEQLHFFPLGAFERTVEYANALPAQIGRSVLTAES